MIAAIVMWLAMAGQGDTRKIVDAYWEIPSGGMSSITWTCTGQCPPKAATVKPAEHVIEIRTKRWTDGKCWDNAMEKYGVCHTLDGKVISWCEFKSSKQEGYSCSSDNDKAFAKCDRVTKTLWWDGQRVGTIREVEEK